MSFSSDVKEELSRHLCGARHCRIAETAAIISMCGRVAAGEDGEISLRFQTENAAVSRKYYTLLKKTFDINTEIIIRRNQYLKRGNIFAIAVDDSREATRILQTAKLLGSGEAIPQSLQLNNPIVVQKSCCKRAYIRGAFLAAGSISDPEKFYHFEIVCADRRKAELLQELMQCFEVDAKIVIRKKSYVVYVKEGSQIVELLGVMEANVALMNLENIRILKEMRNSVNRKVNCETANLNKTVSASVKQLEDISLIKDTAGLESLGEGLSEIALLRLEHPDATLKELGAMLTPAIGKSGVNHRLRKLSELADDIRNGKKEKMR